MSTPKTSLFSNAKMPFYDSWESTKAGDREEQMRDLLRETVEFARAQVPWYAERLEDWDEKAEYPLAAVPILTSDDLRDVLPPRSDALLSDLRDNGFTVFQSGGTTGFPKTTLFSHAELEGLNRLNARGFYAVGLKPEDSVANLWAVGGLYMTFIHMNRMLQQYGCTSFPFANNTANDFVRTITEMFKINCFTGISSVVLSTLRYLYDDGLKDLHIPKIYFGGEHFYDADKKEVAEKFGTEIIAAPGYGTVDTWYLGYQCLSCENGEFHAHDDQCYLEIVNEDTGEHCAPGEVGMLYATAFPRRLTPIIRYRVGDRARWIDDCDCGRTTRRFKLLGRGDDVLRIGFDSIDYNYVQEVCLASDRTTGTIQIEKRRREGRDELIVRAETELPSTEREAAATHVGEAIVEGRPTYRKAIKERAVWPIVVELVSTGILPRNARTGKLVRVIDAIKED